MGIRSTWPENHRVESCRSSRNRDKSCTFFLVDTVAWNGWSPGFVSLLFASLVQPSLFSIPFAMDRTQKKEYKLVTLEGAPKDYLHMVPLYLTVKILTSCWRVTRTVRRMCVSLFNLWPFSVPFQIQILEGQGNSSGTSLGFCLGSSFFIQNKNPQKYSVKIYRSETKSETILFLILKGFTLSWCIYF